VHASELAATPLVLREAGSGTRKVLEAAMRARGLGVIALVELGSTTAIKTAVASGLGPGVLSRLAVESDIRDGRVVEVTVEDISVKRFIRAVWSKGRSLSPSAKRLLRHAHALAGTAT
jgi:DNA-binding transcriptional LysR family regulator